MKTKKIYSTLYDLCRWEMVSEVKERLIENPSDIDVAYDKGLFFQLALASDTTDLLKVLLDYYYDQHGLRQKPETYNTEQKQAKYKLFEILQDAVVSEEMQKTLDDYGVYQNYDNSSTYSQEEIEKLFDFHQLGNHDLGSDFSDNHWLNHDVDLIDTPPMRKSHSMDDIKNHSGKKSDTTHDNSKEKLLTLDQLKEFQLHFDNDHKDDLHSTGEISHHSDDLY